MSHICLRKGEKMNLDERLTDAFRQLKGQNLPSIIAWGRVASVDEDTHTCEVSLVHTRLTLPKVRLSAEPDSESHFLVLPKVGSQVLIGLMDEQLRAVVIAFSQIQRFSCKTATSTLSLDKDHAVQTAGNFVLEAKKGIQLQVPTGAKIDVGSGAVKLGKLLNDLLLQLAILTVPTGVGPSGPPVNAAKFTEIQTKLATLLNTS